MILQLIFSPKNPKESTINSDIAAIGVGYQKMRGQKHLSFYNKSKARTHEMSDSLLLSFASESPLVRNLFTRLPIKKTQAFENRYCMINGLFEDRSECISYG